MSVSKRLRFEILRRDNHACRYCGGRAPEARLTVDHVIPTALGGTDEPENLVTACSDCNSGKSATPADASIVADVAQDQLRWARAMELATEAATAEREARQAFLDQWLDSWNTWSYKATRKVDGKLAVVDVHPELPYEWKQSVWNLHAAGLTLAELVDAIDHAMTAYGVRNEFTYFAGVCRNKLQAKHEVARSIIEEGRA